MTFEPFKTTFDDCRECCFFHNDEQCDSHPCDTTEAWKKAEPETEPAQMLADFVLHLPENPKQISYASLLHMCELAKEIQNAQA